MTVTYEYVFTDTFGGEANYGWVRRGEITLTVNPNVGDEWKRLDSLAMRRAKKALGITGLHGRRSMLGDTIEFRPYGWNAVLFIDIKDYSRTA